MYPNADTYTLNGRKRRGEEWKIGQGRKGEEKRGMKDWEREKEGRIEGREEKGKRRRNDWEGRDRRGRGDRRV